MTSFQIFKEMEINRNVKLPNIAVIPLGAIEQHGPLLPLNTDSIIADAVAREIDLLEEKRLFVYPCFQYVNAETGMAFAGNMSVSHNAIRLIIRDICDALLRHKFDAIVFINGHSPNRGDLLEVSFDIVTQSFKLNNPVPLMIISLEQFYEEIAKEFNLKIGRHGDWFEAFLFKQSGGVFPKCDWNEIDSFALKIPEIPGIAGIPIQYRSIKGVIGEIGYGEEVSEQADNIWQYYLSQVHKTFKQSLSTFNEYFSSFSLKRKDNK
ncbi:MAG: creatininase family protein [Negativicutes bacterium]|nr:creatininase family protein [Negativicutes bacterium]